MCPETVVLSAYFDDELKPAQRIDVEKHLGRCPACRATLDLFSVQRKFLRSGTPSAPAPGDRFARLMTYAGRSRLNRIHGFRRLSIPVPLAAAVVAALLLSAVFNAARFGRKSPELVVVDQLPQSPAMISLTITPGEVNDILALLEGRQGFDTESIHTLPAELPVARYGEPQIVRPAVLEGGH